MTKIKSRAEHISDTLYVYALKIGIERASIDMEALSSLFHFHILSKEELKHKAYHLIMANNNELYHISELEQELSKLNIDIKFKDLRQNKESEYHCISPIYS